MPQLETGNTCHSQQELDRYRLARHLAKGFRGLSALAQPPAWNAQQMDHGEKKTHSKSPQQPLWPENRHRGLELPEHVPAHSLCHSRGREWSLSLT